MAGVSNGVKRRGLRGQEAKHDPMRNNALIDLGIVLILEP